jgi:hypothetical protein
MIKRLSALELAECASCTWKKFARKTAEQSCKRCCITNALDDREDDTLWDSSDHYYPGLKSADSGCETGCTNEEDNEMINLFNLNFQSSVDLCLLIQRSFFVLMLTMPVVTQVFSSIKNPLQNRGRVLTIDGIIESRCTIILNK